MSTRQDIRAKTVALVKDSSGKISTPATTVWAVNTAYALNARVTPKASPNGRIYKCIVAGTSHMTTEPVWPVVDGGQIADNTVTWQEEADDYGRAIDEAIKRYSEHRPATKTVDVVGNGAHDYALPAGWVDGVSDVTKIEYPIGQSPAQYIDKNDWTYYDDPAGPKLRLIMTTIPASASFRVTFIIPRTDATILQNDIEAVATLAASFCMTMLANAFIQLGDSSFGADAVNYRTKSQEAESRAKALLKSYKEQLTLREDDVVDAAAVVGSNELDYPGGMDRLTHPKRYRNLR